MTNERAIELLESYDFEQGNPELFQAAYMGAAALREELAENKPLTPAQLRQICGGKAVWIVREDGEGGWALTPAGDAGEESRADHVDDSVLRRELRRIAIEDRHRCFGCGFEHNCGIHGCAIIREALKRLVPEEANEPLTPERLREMVEGPVWIGGDGLDRWDIFCGVSTDNCACFLRAALPMEGCGKSWVPYLRKPETPADGKEEENT